MQKVYLFDWGDTIMKDFVDEKGPMYSWEKVAIMPNADKMLKELNQLAKCYLATNAKDSTKTDITKALERVNLDKYFTDIFCFREIGASKPSKEYFDAILDRLKTEKSNITMVGDNLESDVMGAINYGIDAVLYDPGNKYPDYKGEKICDLLDLLD